MSNDTNITEYQPGNIRSKFDVTGLPLFDAHDATMKLGEDDSILTELLGMLLQDTIPEGLEQLANEQTPPEDLKKIAHKLKGAALYCSTIRLSQAAEYLEKHSTEDKAIVKALREQLIEVLHQTKVEIDRILSH